MKHARQYFLFLFCLAGALLQVVEGGALSFRHYTVENGLGHNTVSAIIQDKKGFLWIGTENGLQRFDGFSFKDYCPIEKVRKIMISNMVTCLLEDKSGNIWIGTDAGLYMLNPVDEKITRLDSKAQDGAVLSSSVNNMVVDREGCLWISTYGQGIFCYDPIKQKMEQYNLLIEGQVSTRFDYVNQIFVDSQDRVWAASKAANNPLLLFDRKKELFHSFPLKNANFTVYKFYEDSSHSIWLGTWSHGICRLNVNDREVSSFLSTEKAGGVLHIHEITEYKPGILLIGSDDGLSFFHVATGEHQLYRPNEADPTSISDKFIYPILKDHEGGFWIGTYFGGLNYLAPNSGLFERYTHSQYRNSVSGNVVGRFTEDKYGNMWIATDDGSLNKLDKNTGQFTAFLPGKGSGSISYHNVHALCWDDDKLWVGTYSGGLNVLDTKSGKFKYYNSNEKDLRTLDGGSIYSIFKDNESRIWVTSMTGINLYNRATDDFTRVRKTDITTIDIKQDSRGYLWFATLGKGLLRLDPESGKWRDYNCNECTDNCLPNNQVYSIAFDARKTMWVGTGNGLCVYNPRTDSFNEVPVHFPSKVICCIIPAGNDLWLTTTRGLVCYNIRSGGYKIFTRSDGLISDQFVVNSGLRASDGSIYIGCAGGFNRFNPGRLKLNKRIPTVAITGFEIFNKEVEIGEDSPLTSAIGYTDEIHLNYKDNVFSLTFAALSYVTHEKNKFAYKMEGFDKDWNVVTQHKATYTNLPPGEYTFRVRAANNDGVWNDKGTSIRIIIHPPFWFNTFFKLLYFVLIMIGLIRLSRYLKQRTERRHNEEIKELRQQKEKEIYNAKIQFFTMVAHEIRTPVSLIIGPLEKMIQSARNFPDELMNDLRVIDRNAQRLLQLVNQLLDFRKIEQGSMVMNPQNQNIHDILRNVYVRFEPVYKQNDIRFNFNCADKSFTAVVDAEAITKSVSNLLTNALKYAREEVTLSCRKQESVFEIMVRDDGSGVPDGEKTKIFEPFYQVPGTNKQGTGIGLSLVKSIVEAHRGQIAVGDAQDGGAIFSITLPLYAEEIQTVVENNNRFRMERMAEPELSEPAVQSEPMQPTSQHPVLLIVEDNNDMRNFLYENFRNDYQVLTATDGEDGLKCLKSNEVGLIISDLMMPRMDGIEFCTQVRNNYLFSHIPFVMLTAKTDMDSKIEGLNCGADSYLEKPFSIQHLRAVIDNLLESRRLLRKKFSEMPFVPISAIAPNNADERFLAKLNDLIEQNIDNENFNIDQLAEGLHISRSGLFAKIKTLAGITPNEMIQVIRLKKAATYIIEGKHRINEIAYMVGFNNPSYFSKCFQKQFGMTPKDFEKQKR